MSLRDIGLMPTVHKPCLYSGNINGQRVLFMRQVDDFASAAPDAKTSDILKDMINYRLKIPIKRQRYLDMYTGIDILQTRYYIKITLTAFIDKIFKPYLATWMKTAYPSPARSTPLPSDPTWLKKFNAAVGDPDKKPLRRRRTYMGHDDLSTGSLVCKCKIITGQLMPPRTSLPWIKTRPEVPLYLSWRWSLFLANRPTDGTSQRSNTSRPQQQTGHPHG